MKTRLEKLITQNDELTNIITTNHNTISHLQSQIDETKKELKDQEQVWVLGLAEMDKDQLKEFGSNETIRKAKIEVELKPIIDSLREKESELKSLISTIELAKINIKRFSFEKDVLICLINNQ
jgi:hypothetical protein